MASKIRFRIQARNVGPHINLDNSFDTSSLQLGLFANNGSGKTFISRLFRLISKASLSIMDTDKLLRLNESEGSFRFSVTDISNNKNNLVSSFDVALKRGNAPVVNKDLNKYIYHVFNDDYVKENLEEFRYKPNGNIEGYILGKKQIDLSKEKEELDVIEKELISLENSICKNIEKAKKELERLGIRSNTREFSLLTYENVINGKNENLNLSELDSLKNKLINLKSVPDNLVNINLYASKIDVYKLWPIQEYLQKSFSRSDVAEEFKAKIRSKRSFIEEGLSIIKKDDGKCPFCEESLTDNALRIIDMYNEYFKDSEVAQIKKADELVLCLSSIEDEVYRMHDELVHANSLYERYKLFVPSVTDNLRSFESTDEFVRSVSQLKETLEKKKNDVSAIISLTDFSLSIDYLSRYISDIVKDNNINKGLIGTMNKKKDNIQDEKLDIHRKIIRARYSQLIGDICESINAINEKKKDYNTLKEDIHRKEQSEIVDRKMKVSESLNAYLHIFFGGKYNLDEQTFSIKFQDNILSSNAADVLSEGEKSIVAFCYYLADIHNYVNREKDYERLFLIIDDPI